MRVVGYGRVEQVMFRVIDVLFLFELFMQFGSDVGRPFIHIIVPYSICS